MSPAFFKASCSVFHSVARNSIYFSSTPGLPFTKVMSHTGPSWNGRTGIDWARERVGSNIAANASTAMTRIMFFIQLAPCVIDLYKQVESHNCVSRGLAVLPPLQTEIDCAA